MYCKHCGTFLAENAAFCTACGKAMNLTTENPQAPAYWEGAVSPRPTATEAPVVSPPVFAPTPPVQASIALPGPYAGFWLRLVAYLIDTAILTIVFGAVVAILIATVGLSFFRGLAPGMPEGVPNPLFSAAVLGVILLLLPVTIVGTWLYFAWMESSSHQGTLGKMVLGLFVTDMHGRRVSFGRASGRFFAKLITGLIPFLIGYIMAGFTEKKQALHDMIASCLVLKKT